MSDTNSECVLVSLKDGVRFMILNRPKLRNAFNDDVFKILYTTLNNDALDDNVVVTVITGAGSFFTSGLELQLKVPNVEVIKDYFTALINYPKLLIVVVNGPAVGVGVSMLPLCDIVYASDCATFCTPFILNEFTMEACSSYLLPRIVGPSKASEMLLLGKIITAEDALNANLISEIIPHEKMDKLIDKLATFGNLPVSVVKINKKLIRSTLKDKLHFVNDKEMAVVKETLESDVYHRAVSKFKTRRNKL